jgi:hypothetical protein
MQPKWKHVACIGDKDPIAFGGGFVYIDTLGNYCPEMTIFVPATEDIWEKMFGESPVAIYRIVLENDSTKEWWFNILDRVASWTGISLLELQQMVLSECLEEVALVYMYLFNYFGAQEFDSDGPEYLTENEAYVKYANELRFSLKRK